VTLRLVMSALKRKHENGEPAIQEKKSKDTSHATETKGPSEPVPEVVLHLINHDFNKLDDKMDEYLKLVSDLGAYQCWHKHGTFGEHLLGVWKIFQTWKLPQTVCRMGLFHSTYSNSWVGLALYKPNTERHKLRAIVGDETEALVHIMCSVPRMSLTFKDILGLENKGVPAEGIVVKDIHTGADLPLSQRMVAIYIVFHIADWLEQFYGWQDKLFRVDDLTGDDEGDMAVPFLKMLNNEFVDNAGTLWPGVNQPGLYLSVLTKLGLILKSCNQPDLLPPVFDNCSKFLPAKDEKKARDLYWTVTTKLTEAKDGKEAQELLIEAIKLNPFIAEPHILLGQIYMREGRIEDGIAEARQALKLLYAMGTNWDKRVSWEAWINWCRVMIRLGLKKEWPTTSMGIINVGLVEDK